MSTQVVESVKITNRLGQGIYRKNPCTRRVKAACLSLLQQSMNVGEVHFPDRTVFSVPVQFASREMERHKRRVSPVEQSSRQPMMLCHAEPVPVGVPVDNIGVGVLFELFDEIALHIRIRLSQPRKAIN